MNWVSKALYLERKINALEKTLKLLTDHMQVDEDGNIIIEANKFDLHTNDELSLLSHNNFNIKITEDGGNFNIDSASNGDTNINLGYTVIDLRKFGASLEIYANEAKLETNDNIILITNRSIELQPTDRLTSTKALEVVE